MSKITLDRVASGYDLSKINNNFQTIQTALNNTLSRDGTTPNTMSANLDMNGYRLINELASTGNGFIWKGAWLTATAYAINNLVSENGSTYICTTAHTSGNFVTDLAAGKWEVVASKGASGGGSGDLVSANNLSDVANVAAARSNLGLQIGVNVQEYDEQLAELAAIVPAQGDIIYHNGTDWVKLAAGTSGHFLKTLGAGANPAWDAAPTAGTLTVGTPLVLNPYTVNTTTTQAHGLGVQPSFFKVEMECLTIDTGWQVGDKIDVTSMITTDGGTASDAYIMVYSDATNTNLLLGVGPICFGSKVTRSRFYITTASWKITVTPYKLN